MFREVIARLTEVNETFKQRVTELEKIVEATIEKQEKEKNDEIQKAQFHSHRVKIDNDDV